MLNKAGNSSLDTSVFGGGCAAIWPRGLGRNMAGGVTMSVGCKHGSPLFPVGRLLPSCVGDWIRLGLAVVAYVAFMLVLQGTCRALTDLY